MCELELKGCLQLTLENCFIFCAKTCSTVVNQNDGEGYVIDSVHCTFKDQGQRDLHMVTFSSLPVGVCDCSCQLEIEKYAQIYRVWHLEGEQSVVLHSHQI